MAIKIACTRTFTHSFINIMARKGIFDRLGNLVDEVQTANKKNKKEATADKSLFDRLRGEIETVKKKTPKGEDESKTTEKIKRRIDKVLSLIHI